MLVQPAQKFTWILTSPESGTTVLTLPNDVGPASSKIYLILTSPEFNPTILTLPKNVGPASSKIYLILTSPESGPMLLTLPMMSAGELTSLPGFPKLFFLVFGPFLCF